MSAKSLEPVIAHFATIDPPIATLLEKVGSNLPVLPTMPRPDFFFHQLCREIVGQQLSMRVANVIIQRFEALFPEVQMPINRGAYRQSLDTPRQITPEFLATLRDEQLRQVGMSGAKVRSVRDLAAKVLSKEVDLAALPKLTDEEVKSILVQVRGIGPWTADMFLIFTLGREDIFSWGDLGLRRGIENYFGEFSEVIWRPRIEQWKPYRTYASLALWASLDSK